MRVIGGSARSLRLQCHKGLHVRPTADIIRETLFNVLGPRVVGAVLCDLYAGCGSVGIEALSRGAERCVFVEAQRGCVRAIEANLQHTGLAERATVVCGRMPGIWSAVVREHGPFDLLFVDPPYGHEPLAELAERLVLRGEGVAEAALVMIQRSEHDRTTGLPEPDQVKTFGETVVELFQVAGRGTASDE